ncbi:hypothetical protein [Methylococcus sp. EFPC2]|uniref:hypothetical protein n=1 Tax=Methylococcus sp. EFPC2 TaxID=2812648 RepID=UPI0019679D3F|nr:hypothetical protein [Methylococcus sp. EFPC2]QSA95856.1 hypothetical protein JWZ97_11455 [Methylococcus sp. EFPC2]
MSSQVESDRASSTALQAARDVRDYFKQTVTHAIVHQRVEASEEAAFYLVELLAQFTRSDALFECTADGVGIKPLALCYADAVQAESRSVRHQALKRLGDVALMVAGMFSASLTRKVVGMDYYIAMGGSAYAFLSESLGGAPARVFGELAAKFQPFVDVLGEVSDQTSLRAPQDVLRIYDNWTRTGSRRAAAQLRRLGIEPAIGSIRPM